MAIDRDQYVRSVELVRVIDGDTAVVLVDLGFYVKARMSCRLSGLNAPEHDQPSGLAAKSALEHLLNLGPLTVQSVRADKYAGRFDAVVMVATPHGPVNVNEALIADGYALPWDGKGKRPVAPWDGA